MKEKKLGGGILTCSIIYIILSVGGIYSLIDNLLHLEEKRQVLIEGQKAVAQSGSTFFKSAADTALAQATTLNFSISLVFSIIIFISLILILFKKKVGVYSCFIAILLRSIYSVIVGGFSILSLIGLLMSLILPGLLGLFIYKRRSIFGFANPDEDQAIDA
ncbi:hypothetical protein [Clostridium gasigenes]|uniref:DUF4064 domain-containing protein n=1 Tax=Clostridium gasigenes TaxID=94869 RepID=A0A1H0M0H0_9CLOT|nr:hypothetical protein [Clostridium gasigenes]MBB6622304.1 hypothetical protein [Clostridium gasigenes]SDO73972.1 hypothetical protein SAMN04488529_101276 [Clostridium gasigenes]